MAAATARNTIRAVDSPIEVSAPRPVMARADVAMTTVPPAKTTADPDEPMAWASALSLDIPALRFSR
jgi:hypothetical protein